MAKTNNLVSAYLLLAVFIASIGLERTDALAPALPFVTKHRSGRSGCQVYQSTAFVAEPNLSVLGKSWTNKCQGSRFARIVRHMTENDSTALSGNKPVGIIIAGAPASGKGTQCEMIQELYGVVHLSTGDMLRAAVAAKTPVGVMAKDYMDSGKLVPDDVIIGVVKDRLNEEDCKNKGWLLDGFPRTRAQADALAGAGVSADCFLFLNVPDDVLVERVVGRRSDPETGKIYHMTFSPPPQDEELLKRLVHRSDDTEEKVRVRLEQFHKNVDAVLGCYTDIAVEVDGTGKPAEVADTIRDALAKRCGAAIAA